MHGNGSAHVANATLACWQCLPQSWACCCANVEMKTTRAHTLHAARTCIVRVPVILVVARRSVNANSAACPPALPHLLRRCVPRSTQLFGIILCFAGVHVDWRSSGLVNAKVSQRRNCAGWRASAHCLVEAGCLTPQWFVAQPRGWSCWTCPGAAFPKACSCGACQTSEHPVPLVELNEANLSCMCMTPGSVLSCCSVAPIPGLLILCVMQRLLRLLSVPWQAKTA